MKRSILYSSVIATTALLMCSMPLRAAETTTPPDKGATADKPQIAPEESIVQIAILLDTSSSMEGLIGQAKTQLWKIVNEFISAKQNGKTPVVQVALYEYGKDSLNPKDYWIRQIQPLTRDLDKISEELFALTTNGGEEYCGAVIRRAVNDLAWDPSPNTYKAIFIAGNEPFTQGPINPIKSCKEAIAKGIVVNTIHCGPESEGIQGHWNEGALVADGKFLDIDQNKAVAHVEAPQDREIVSLNEELNKTYIAYGKAAAEGKEKQMSQDINAAANASSGAQLQRAVSKASSNYCNSRWDIVDASKQKEFSLEKVKTEDLPPELQKMTLDERKAYVEKMGTARADLQKRILTLNKEREAYVASKQKNDANAKTLDTEVAKAVKSQAAKKGIAFEK
jgi:hypothetical protein